MYANLAIFFEVKFPMINGFRFKYFQYAKLNILNHYILTIY
jgi:hypothetical protein